MENEWRCDPVEQKVAKNHGVVGANLEKHNHFSSSLKKRTKNWKTSDFDELMSNNKPKVSENFFRLGLFILVEL